MKHYFIHQKRRTDRLPNFAKAKALFPELEMFDAISGMPDIDQRMSAGRMGCYCSHLAILLELASKNTDGIVLEDDVEFSANAKTLMTEAIRQLPEDWDMLYFGCNHFAKPKYYSTRLEKVIQGYTTHAYMISRNFVGKAIRSFIVNHRPADINYARLHPESKVFCITPMIAWQGDGYSDVVRKHTSTKKEMLDKQNVK